MAPAKPALGGKEEIDMTYALSSPIRGPVAWLGKEMAGSREWVRPFAAREVEEIDAALRSVQRRGLAWPKFGREDFPLPTFSRDLAAVLDELETGRGFVVLRGFPVERYGEEELKTVYWGVGSHLGHP